MNLRHLLAPVAIAALAVAPVAATTAATAGTATTNNQTFVDTDQATPANAVNIVKTHVSRTSSDFRAVVSYKTYNALKATRYNVFFLDFGDSGSGSAGNVLDLRINPQGQASVLAYGIDSEDGRLVKSTCQGNKVFSGKNTLTFVINKSCWYSTTSPDLVLVGTKHYTSSTAYAKGTPTDPLMSETETATSDSSNNAEQDGWDWGGPTTSNPKSFSGLRSFAARLHM